MRGALDSVSRRSVADNGTVPSAANPRATTAAPTPTGGARGAVAANAGISRPWLYAGLAALFLGLVAALLFSGAAAAREVSDPGALVRWGLPVADVVGNLTAPATFGLLLLAAFLAPERTHTDRRATAIRWASGTAVVWFVASLLEVVLTYADLAGTPLTAPGLLQQVLHVLLERN